jgi:phosphate/phosphite/phosphonate ABC transporter binding protein
MEYVSGVPLNILMRKAAEQRVAVPVGVAIGIITQSCAGAHAAHDLKDPTGHPANLVHRDLTPHNLMIAESGHVKILDFGVAKASTNEDKTETGMLKGKLPYMSPEQLWQAEIDRRSDVFTLGVVFWELLTGDKLYAREGEVATINAVLNSTIPSIDGFRPDVPSAVVATALQALEKDQKARTPTAEALRSDLLGIARDHQLDCSEEAIQDFIKTILGTSLAARRTEVAAQVEKSIGVVPEGSPTKKSLDQTGTTQMHAGSDSEPRSVTQTVMLGALVSFLSVSLLLIGLHFTGKLEPQAATDTPTLDAAVTVMLAPTVSPDILREDLEPLRRYLQRELGEVVDWRFADSYADTAEALLTGAVDFASLPPTLYVQTKASNPAVELVAVKVHSGTTGSDGVLLVRAEGPVQETSDIKGKRPCYTDPQSTTGYILPRATLRGLGINPDTDLASPAVISGNHIQLIRDLIEGRCDIGGTFMAAYMNAEAADINSALARVLHVTGRTPHDAITAGPHTPETLKERVKKALLDFDPSIEAGQKTLGAVEKITGFGPVEDSVYDSVRRAVDAERSALLTE